MPFPLSHWFVFSPTSDPNLESLSFLALLKDVPWLGKGVSHLSKGWVSLENARGVHRDTSGSSGTLNNGIFLDPGMHNVGIRRNNHGKPGLTHHYSSSKIQPTDSKKEISTQDVLCLYIYIYKHIPSLKVTYPPWKLMIARWTLLLGPGLFSEAKLNFEIVAPKN